MGCDSTGIGSLYNREKDCFMPVSFEGHPLNVVYNVFVDDGLRFLGRGSSSNIVM